jgi:pyruvate/2-oxoglutarate dehydrogenase complex dihydrolipoamide acyltransferase (E2) component
MFQDYKVAYLRERVKVKQEMPLSFLRQSVAYVLSLSTRTIPHVAMIRQFDVTPLVEYTKSADRDGEGEGASSHEALLKRALRKNYSAFFIKTIAHCLHYTPVLNGFLDYTPWRNGGTFYIAEDINLSFTVHTKFGVIKPIVRNPHLKTLETVANEMRDLSRRARRTDAEALYRGAAVAYVKAALKQLNLGALLPLWILVRSLLWQRHTPDPEFANVPDDKRLQVEEILGATCTVANIGMVVPGHQTVTAIIPPEVMMFGLGDLHQAPLVVDGTVMPRYVITMCGTADHRAFDPGEAFSFVDRFQHYIDNPALIYAWKPGDAI